MPVLGITGGIATGKSSFVRALRAELPGPLFDADATAHALLAEDEAVRRSVAETFGPSVLDAAGRPDRLRLRSVVFGEPDARRRLEAILHPVIRERWLAQAAEYRERGPHSPLCGAGGTAQGLCGPHPAWLFVDIPLLYETEAQHEFDRVVVVACSPAVQRARMREQRKLDSGLIESIIGAQFDLELKVARATHVVWNDSTLACLERQARLLAALLRTFYV
ncbi:MAG TPA: dephospho-CoA kinase [Chthoniobacteraceae bacterium]|nr:dephospho-CoA kinase [Chthoniobacteraceae bacterium]